MYLGGASTRHVRVNIKLLEGNIMSKEEREDPQAGWFLGGQSADQRGWTVHILNHDRVEVNVPVYVFDMDYIRSSSAQLLFCDRVVELYAEIAARESKERCFNLTKGKLDLNISQGSSSLGKHEYVFHLSRTDVAKSDDSDEDRDRSHNSTNLARKKNTGLSVQITSLINTITTKVSFCAKTEASRGAWVRALKNNLSIE